MVSLQIKILLNLFLPILCLEFTLAQTVAPYPYAYCSNNLVDSGSYCPDSSINCCAAGAACCAGGCCPTDASCIYQGTSNEACCPASDPSACGAAQPEATPTGPPASGPSVSCVGADDTWYCPYGYTCLSATEGCLPPPGGEEYSSSPAAATSYYYTDSPAASTSYSENPAAATSFQDEFTTPSATTNILGVTNSVSSASTAGSAATTTTKKNEGVKGGIGGYGAFWVVSSVLMAVLGFGRDV